MNQFTRSSEFGNISKNIFGKRGTEWMRPDEGLGFPITPGSKIPSALLNQPYFKKQRDFEPVVLKGLQNSLPKRIVSDIERSVRLPNNSEIENVPQLMTNAHVPITRYCKTWGLNEPLYDSLIGQMLFVHKEEDARRNAVASINRNNLPLGAFGIGGPRTTQMPAALTPMSTVYTLQKINRELCKERLEEEEIYPDAFKRLKDISFDGVVISQVGGDYRNGAGPRQQGLEENKAMVVTMQGPALMHNYWDNTVCSGTRLFLLIKRTDLPKEFRIQANINAAKTLTRLTDEAGNRFVEKPFQIIPWCSNEFYEPPKAALEYQDPNGLKRIGAYIHVGVCQSVQSLIAGSIRNANGSISSDAQTLVSRPKISVFINSQPMRW